MNSESNLSRNKELDPWGELQADGGPSNEQWQALIQENREKLKRMVQFRLSPKLQGRVDASDVIQDTFAEAARVMRDAEQRPEIPFKIWLRRLADQKLIQIHRQHLGAACRSVEREQGKPLSTSQASSLSIAQFLVGTVPSPSRAAVANEKRLALEQALEQMDPIDREVLVLRHFEQLSGPESAQILGLSHDAVKKRYVRALEKLQTAMAKLGVLG